MSLLSFTKFLQPNGDAGWLVGRGVPDDPDASWLTADGKAFDAPADVKADIRGLPPERARLAQFVAWRRLVAERLANLDSGIDELCRDLVRVTEAQDRLQGLRAADTSSLLDSLR